MIQYVSEFSVTESLRETLRSTPDGFPFAANELNVIEDINNCAKWHWHDFIEVGYVLEGEIECCTPRRVFTLSRGDGFFINASVLHMNRMAAGSSDAKYRVLQFETGMLDGGGIIARKYTAPVEKRQDIEALPLLAADARQRQALEEVCALFDIAAREPACYELQVLRGVAQLWTRLYALAEPLLASAAPAAPDSAALRVKSMLAFIHDHYADPIGVDDIAAAANISRREAFRAFRSVLSTTPTLYMLQHRINCGARLLMETERSVTWISADCGFSSPSYFCKAFHDLTGLSPREFRRRSGR